MASVICTLNFSISSMFFQKGETSLIVSLLYKESNEYEETNHSDGDCLSNSLVELYQYAIIARANIIDR